VQWLWICKALFALKHLETAMILLFMKAWASVRQGETVPRIHLEVID
jgi:hypothetical protein